MSQPLKFENYGISEEGEPLRDNWFRLYECEHVTNGSYPLDSAIPLGEHTNLALCKHCWSHLKGLMAQEMIKKVVDHHVLKEFEEIMHGPQFIEKLIEAMERREKLLQSE